MAEEVRKRAACDRCHAQKTRCPRKPGQEICDRCLKAKATCVFSPFRQKKLPEETREFGELFAGIGVGVHEKGGNEQSFDSVARLKRRRLMTDLEAPITTSSGADLMLDGSGLDFGADWISQPFPPTAQCLPDINDVDFEHQDPYLSFDFNNTPIDDEFGNLNSESFSGIDMSIEERRNINLDRSLRMTSGLTIDEDDSSSPSASFHSGTSDYIWGLPPQRIDSGTTAYCVKKLSQLSIDLFEHSQTVPPQSIHDPNSPENGDLCVMKAGQQKYVVEDTFRLTQAMIEIYPSFLSAFASQKDGTTISPCGGPIDHSSILLILSCHLRLISVYEELFKHMDACVKQNGRALTKQQKLMSAPQFKIGSYIPPNSSAIPMQILLLVQFATQLFHYASDLAAEIVEPAITPLSDSSSTSSTRGSPQDPTLALTRAAAENVKERASSMSTQLTELRKIMMAAGIPA